MKSIYIFLISFFIVSFINITIAQEKFEQRSIEEALNPDGTLKQGVQGSFKVEGYEMHTGANGNPIFVPKTRNTASGNWEPLGTGAQNGVNSDVHAIALDGQGRVYVGGPFTQAGGVSANRVALYDPQTNIWSTLGTGAQNGLNGIVNTLALDGQGRVYVGGSFTQAGGVSASRLARFDPQTNTWSALGIGAQNGVNGIVYALALDGQGRLYVGGSFTQAGGVSANYVARFDPATNTWSALGTGAQNGVNNRVEALALDGQDRVYVGGSFTQAGGVSANYVARFDLQTNIWSTLSIGTQNGVDFRVIALALDGQGRVYVGGSFIQAGGVSANRVALYHPQTNAWSTLGTASQNGVNNHVYALALDGQGRVYVGGGFQQAGGGVSANYVVRWNSGTTSVEQIGDDLPKTYLLSQNYPNPFNPSTTISFSIPTSEFVTLKVYDVLGREVATLVNENLSAGSYSYNFDASSLTSGVYFYKLQAGKYNETKKMILSK